MPALARRATKSTAETAQLQTEAVSWSWVRLRVGVEVLQRVSSVTVHMC